MARTQYVSYVITTKYKMTLQVFPEENVATTFTGLFCLFGNNPG